MDTAAEDKKRVLIVDDEQRILKFLGLMLKASGYDVATAANGKEGLQIAEREKPDIILLDIVMPVMDGFEMLQNLRAFSQTPVIIFSARGQTSEKAISLGANKFIPKPFKPEEVLRLVKEVLEAKKETAGK